MEPEGGKEVCKMWQSRDPGRRRSLFRMSFVPPTSTQKIHGCLEDAIGIARVSAQARAPGKIFLLSA
jgi:hypothetical protein